MINAFEKQQIFVPDIAYKALEQLEVAIAFIEAVCGRDSIAAEGYSTGRDILKTHKKRFDDWTISDPQFLLKYLLFLDRMFYLFCKELQEYEHSPDPLIDARPQLEGWLHRNVREGILSYIQLGIKPEFSVPRCLQGRTAHKDGLLDLRGAPPAKPKAAAAAGKAIAGQAGGGGGGVAAVKKLAGDGGGAGKSPPPTWHAMMPQGEFVPEWQLPVGKRFGDFFGSHLPENNRIFPRYPHHKNKRPTSICARYQIEGARECKFGADCSLTHVRPKEIPRAVKDKITVDIQALYTKGAAT